MGNNQTLFKPNSEKNGNAVILISNAKSDNIAYVEVLSNGQVVDIADNVGKRSNGDRADFRLDRPGSAYGNNVSFRVVYEDGSTQGYNVGAGASRFEQNDDTQFGPNAGSPVVDFQNDTVDIQGFSSGESSIPSPPSGNGTGTISGQDNQGQFGIDGAPSDLQVGFLTDENGQQRPFIIPSAAVDPNDVPSISFDQALNDSNRIIDQNFVNNQRVIDQAGDFADQVVETELRNQQRQIEQNAPIIRAEQDIDAAINIQRGNDLDERNRESTRLANADTILDTEASNRQLREDKAAAVDSTGLDFVGNTNSLLEQAGRVAQGDFSSILPSGQLDRELSNRGADIAGSLGVNARSVAGTDIGKKLSAEFILNTTERARQEFSNILFGAQRISQSEPNAAQVQTPRVTDVPFTQSQVGSDIELTPISGGESQQQFFNQNVGNATLNPDNAFSNSLRVQENEQDRVQSILDFEQGLFNSQGQAVQSALDEQQRLTEAQNQRDAFEEGLEQQRENALINAGTQFVTDTVLPELFPETFGRGTSGTQGQQSTTNSNGTVTDRITLPQGETPPDGFTPIGQTTDGQVVFTRTRAASSGGTATGDSTVDDILQGGIGGGGFGQEVSTDQGTGVGDNRVENANFQTGVTVFENLIDLAGFGTGAGTETLVAGGGEAAGGAAGNSVYASYLNGIASLAAVGFGIDTAADVFSATEDLSQSQAEKEGAKGGASAGASIGAGIGTYIFPGFGTVIGGAIGAVVGAIGGAVAGTVGTGKGSGQLARDAYRDAHKESGFINKEDNTILLANGSKYDFGRDGTDKLDNVDGTQRNTFDLDFSNPLAVENIGASHLFALATGLSPDMEFDTFTRVANQGLNAATSNAGSSRDVLNNIGVMMLNAGADPISSAARLEVLRATNQISDRNYRVYMGNLNEIFGSKIQTVDKETGRAKLLESIAQVEEDDLTPYQTQILETLTSPERLASNEATLNSLIERGIL